MATLSMRIEIIPESKGRPRMNTKSGFVYTPAKTRSYENAIRDAWHRYYGGRAPIEGPIELNLEFRMPRPKGMMWKKKAMPQVPHTHRPDLDNLEKAILDALNGVAWRDDAQVWHVEKTKWICSGDMPVLAAPCIIITIRCGVE